MGQVDVVVWAGASGVRGVTTTPVPAGIPTAAVRFWNCTGTSATPDDESTAFEDMRVATDGRFAAELQMGLTLNGIGRKTAIIKIGMSNTECSAWRSGIVHDLAVQVLGDAVAAIPAEFPLGVTRYHFCWFLGATDAGDPGTMKADIEGIRSEFSGIIGRPFFSTTLVLQHKDSTIVTAAVNAAARVQTLLVSAARCINVDDQALVDTIHLTGAGQNVLGLRLANSISTAIVSRSGDVHARSRHRIRRR